MRKINDKSLFIRGYIDSDIMDLLKIWEDASRKSHDFFPSSFFIAERERVSKLYIPNALTYVAELDENAIGFISMIGNEIGGLFISPKFQGMGVGGALIHHVSEQHSSLDVRVFLKNKSAISFYLKNRFKIISDDDGEYYGERMLKATKVLITTQVASAKS